MKIYAFALGIGALAGVVCELRHARSPAPALLALTGRLGLLAALKVRKN